MTMRPAACRSAITDVGVPASAMKTRTSTVVSRLPVSWICHDARLSGCGRASTRVCRMSPSVPLHAVTVIARTSAVELRIETPSLSSATAARIATEKHGCRCRPRRVAILTRSCRFGVTLKGSTVLALHVTIWAAAARPRPFRVARQPRSVRDSTVSSERAVRLISTGKISTAAADRPTAAPDRLVAPPTAPDSLPLRFDDVFRRYAPYVGALVLRLVGRAADVDDIVQDVFIQAHRDLA